MTLDDVAFLSLRVGLGLLCFYAAWGALRLGLGHGHTAARRWRGLAGASLLTLIGLLHLGTGLEEGLARAGEPVRRLDWVWLGIDLLVPLFFLRMSEALRQRDALEQALIAAAMRDPLTGLHNRAGFAEAAAHALAGADRQGEPSVAVMMDVDHFKSVNDGFGHAAGDAVLRGVAASLRQAMRRQDALGRIGGEEFAAVLPGLTPQAALPIVDRLRRAITTEVAHPGAPDRVLTLSAGIARVGPAGLEAAFNAADQALYAAKAAGRNQTLLADDTERRAKETGPEPGEALASP